MHLPLLQVYCMYCGIFIHFIGLLKDHYKVTRFLTADDQWPPVQPHHFTPLVLIKHSDKLDKNVIVNQIKGNVGPNCDGISEDLQCIFSKLEQLPDITVPHTILVEGLPGIGKTTLLKQISFLWANNVLFENRLFLFLLHLRDPDVQNIKTLNDFLSHCIYYTDESIRSLESYDSFISSIINRCCTQLLQDNGRSAVIVLDGYDEYPVELRRKSFISSIIDREVLCCSAIVISSRPHASTNLRSNVLFQVEILGFSEDDRMHFIEQTLTGKTQKIEELKIYLGKHPTISSFCYIPFNMTILLYLYKHHNYLPSSSSELCEIFINETIDEHLAREKRKLQSRHQDLSQLPQRDSIIKQLSRFAFEKLVQDQLVFSHAEIEQAYPEIDKFPNYFGLLQAVECAGRFRNEKKCAYNFIHLSVQEHFAAKYINDLQEDDDQIYSILKRYFWDGNLHNMFNFYIAMTKGQQSAFKRFLCNGNSVQGNPINAEFLEDTRKSLRLYRCFHEAKDKVMLSKIEQRFSDKVLGLDDTASPAIEDVTTVLTCSKVKFWEIVWFKNCYISDSDIKLLHHSLKSSGITIDRLFLTNSHVTSLSDNRLSEIILTCKVKALRIKENRQNEAVGETEQFITSILSPPSEIQELSIQNNKYSSDKWIEHLFKVLKMNTSLEWLWVPNNNITDPAVNRFIIPALCANKTLKRLSIHDNPITEKASLNIVEAVIQDSTKLEKLQLPKCSGDMEKCIVDKTKNNTGQIKLIVMFS